MTIIMLKSCHVVGIFPLISGNFKCDVTVYCLNLETNIPTLRVSGYPLSLWALVCEILKNSHVCFQFNVLLETIVIRRCDAFVPLPFTVTVFTSGIITTKLIFLYLSVSHSVHRGGLCQGLPQTEPPQTKTPLDRYPQTETPMDRDPLGKTCL